MKRRIGELPILMGLIMGCLMFIGCGYKEEIASLQKENTQLKEEIARLKEQILALENENQRLKETDEGYFKRGVDAFNMGTLEGYEKAIELFTQLIQKFPDSSYTKHAKTYISKAKQHIEVINMKHSMEELLKKGEWEKCVSILTKLRPFISPEEYEEYRKRIEEEKYKPVKISYDEFYTMARTGMKIGKRYKVCACVDGEHDYISREEASLVSGCAPEKSFIVTPSFDSLEKEREFVNIKGKMRYIVVSMGLFGHILIHDVGEPCY